MMAAGGQRALFSSAVGFISSPDLLLVASFGELLILALVQMCLLGPSAASSDSTGPRFTADQPDVVEFSNLTGTTLHCQAFGTPQPSVAWVLADTSPVLNVTGLRVAFPNGTLLFPAFRAEYYRQDVHAAVYKCLASNSLGSVLSREVKIKAVTVQPFELYVYDTYVINGNTAVFKCHVPNFLKDYVSVTSWIRDGAFSIQSEGIDSVDGKYVVLPNGDLVLRHVEMKDAHTSFRCQAIHRLTGELKNSVTSGKLFVTEPVGNVPPRLLGVLPEVTVLQGNASVLPCIANGHPLPTVSWYVKRNSQMLPLAQDARIRVLHEGLLLNNVQLSDAGQYVCQATTGLAKELAEITLEVIVPMKVTMKPSVLTATIGSSATLSCDIVGYPVKEIQWVKDGKPVPVKDALLTNKNTTLTLDPVAFNHKGMYQCIAKDDQRSVQGAAQLLLGDMLPVFISVFSETLLRPGNSLSLKCEASGTPLPDVHWFLEDVEVSEDKVFQIVSLESIISWLNVSRVASEDGGVYKCTATNKVGAIHHSSRVNVYGKLSSRERPKMSVVAGHTVWINCPVYGYPIQSVAWEKGDEILPAHLRQTVLRNGTLRLENIERSRDSGIYRCTAKNNVGESAQGVIDIKVMVPPKITPFALDDRIREGSRVRLHCVISDGDLPLTIIWYKDGQLLENTKDINIRELDDFSSILTISYVRSDHNGNYTCQASNDAATDRYAVRLSVNVPPRWIVKPQDSAALQGTDITLDCSATGFPVPIIQWMKARGDDPNDDRELLVTNGHMNLLTNGSLLIRRVLKKHEGHYFCLASNGIGDGLSKATFLQIHGPAKFDRDLKEEMFKINENATIICEALGDVPINFTWIANNKNINPQKNNKYIIKSKNNDTKDSAKTELVIVNLTRNDFREFTCRAANAFGKDDLTIRITVLEPPEAPVIGNVTPLVNGSVQIKWTSPFDGNKPIIKLLAQYKESKVDWEKSTNATFLSPRDVVSLTGLTPFTRHDVRIFVFNEIGTSSQSNVESFTTEEEAPSGSPLDVEVESVDKKSLRITWKPPPQESRNGIIKGYKLGYKISGSEDPYAFVNIDTPADYVQDLLYELNDLQMYTQYSIIIQVFNSRGMGPLSDEVVVVTSEDVPNRAPGNVRCSSLSTKTIYVLWDNISPEHVNGILRGYRVFFKQADDWSTVTYQSKSTEFPRLTIQGLEVNTNYSIQVLAYTKVGDGVKSNPIFCKTHEDVPSAPGDIKVLPASSSSVLVAWKQPAKPNGAVTKYNVYVRPVDEDEEINPGMRYSKDAVSRPDGLDDTNVHTSKNDHIYEIQGLDPSKRYEFWVTAVSVVGEGPRSRVMSQSSSGSTVAAQTASFDEVLRTPWKRDLSMPCRAVGIPPPQKQWSKAGKELRDNDRLSISQEGTLLIKKVRKDDAGNYTCAIHNVYGTDEVRYAVFVVVPPPPPALGVYSKSVSSLELKWQRSNLGEAPVRGYLLFYKKEDEQWATMELPPENDSFTLKNLICGSVYHLYMVAINSVGKGDPSDTITISTDGGAPEPPSKERLIREGATFLSLQLDAWAAASCPIKHFVAEYRRADENSWTVISNEVKPSQKRLVVPGLVPGTWYHVRVTAHSNTGPTLAEYICATLTQNGATIAPYSPEQTEIIWMSLDWILILVSVLLAVILILILIGLVCLRRRRSHRKRHPTAGNPIHSSVESFVHLHGNNPTATRVYASLQRETLSNNVDTNPYASYTLPGCNPGVESEYNQMARPPGSHRSKSNISQPRMDMTLRPKSESAASSPAWTVYTNDTGLTKTLSKGSSGPHNIDIKDIQSRPLPPTPQHSTYSTNLGNPAQETVFIFPDNSPGHARSQRRRKFSNFGRRE